MDEAIRQRVLRHAALHDDLAHHSEEQRQWGEDLRALLAAVERLSWLRDHGESYFGSLWREATDADIDALMGNHGLRVLTRV